MGGKLANFLSALAVDPKKYAEYQASPDSAIIQAGLNDDESAALKSGDPARVYALLAGQNDSHSISQEPPRSSPESLLFGSALPVPIGTSPQPPTIYYVALPPGGVLLVSHAQNAVAQPNLPPTVWAVQALAGMGLPLEPMTLWAVQVPAAVNLPLHPMTLWASQGPASASQPSQAPTFWAAQPQPGVSQPAQTPTVWTAQPQPNAGKPNQPPTGWTAQPDK